MELQITDFQRNLIEKIYSALAALELCKNWLCNSDKGTYIRFYNQASGSYYIVER